MDVIQDKNFKFDLDIRNQRDYSLIKEQIDTMHRVTFGSSINVLLVTDRLYGCALGLAEYLQNSTDITVDVVTFYEYATEIIHEKPVDFLIIVGYLQVHHTYDIVQYCRNINKYSSVVFFASVDGLIRNLQSKYEIQYSYNRRHPIDGFVAYLRELYAEESDRMQKEVPPETTREQLRVEALQELVRAEVKQDKNHEELKMQSLAEQKKKRLNMISNFFKNCCKR